MDNRNTEAEADAREEAVAGFAAAAAALGITPVIVDNDDAIARTAIGTIAETDNTEVVS